MSFWEHPIWLGLAAVGIIWSIFVPAPAIVLFVVYLGGLIRLNDMQLFKSKE